MEQNSSDVIKWPERIEVKVTAPLFCPYYNPPVAETPGGAHYWNVSNKWADWVDDPEKPYPIGSIGFHPFPYWKAEDELFPSGLVGPVSIKKNAGY